MPTYVGLLRAINVGSRKLAMADLRTILTDLGASDVQTYVQSGNVVFRAPAKTASSVQDSVSEFCGFDVRVLLRSVTDLEKIIEDQPYDGPESAWHVTFLERVPAKAAVAAIDPTAFEPDTFTVAGREVFLRCPDGYGRSKLSNAYFEKKLGVAATTRNWRTVLAVAELARRR